MAIKSLPYSKNNKIMRVMLKFFLGFIGVIILTSCTSKKGIEGNSDNKRAPLDIIKQVQPGKTLEYIKQYLGAPHEKDVLTLKDKNNDEKYQVNRFFYNLDNMNVMVGFIDGEVCYASFEIKNYDEKFDIYPCGVDGYGVHLRLGESTFSNIIKYGSLVSDDVKGINEPALFSSII